MVFALSILYLLTSYVTPPVLFGPLGYYRIELIIAALILLGSLPKLAGSIVLKTSQSLALLGLTVAVFMSVLIGEHWAGGAFSTFVSLMPSIFGYFLVCLHCNSKKRLQILVFMLLVVCLFVIAHGWIDLQYGVSGGAGIQQGSDDVDEAAWDAEHPYLMPFDNSSGQAFYRLRGLGLINDPNDFGQLLVCVTPLVFIFWRAKRLPQNIFFVLLPVCVLLYGVFLTHSRGALLALLAMAVVGLRRRIGTLPSLLLAGVLFVGAMALNFTGGRDISAESGSDRTGLWSESMQLLKSHPLFGIGAGNLSDYLGHTAHNSVMVCAAELGCFGLFFWCLFLFSTVRDASVAASSVKVTEGVPIVVEKTPFQRVAKKIEEIDKAEINRLGRLLVLSLTGFLVAGWFLSRALVMTFFLLGGMVEVVYEMAVQRGMIAPRLRLGRLLPYAGGLAILLIVAMYINLRVANLMH